MAPAAGVPDAYRPGVRNILQTLEMATAAEWEAGALWYPNAHKVASELAPDPATGAGILAALSPQRAWAPNVQDARDLAAGRRPRYATRANLVKAQAILDGAPWQDVLGDPRTTRRISRGAKVRNFAACIADPWDPWSVVIDRHAFDVAVGRITSDAERTRVLGRVGVYDRFARTYRAAARATGEAPNVIQAVVWVTWRRLKGLPE